MNDEFERMWAKKLGMTQYDAALLKDLLQLMIASKADYTMFFRKLSHIPEHIAPLKESFYVSCSDQLDEQWNSWLQRWRTQIAREGNHTVISAAMKRTNPKYAWREWLIAPAYKKAEQGDYSLIRELQSVFSQPYDEQSQETERTFDLLKPKEFFHVGGISHYSCSS